MLPEDAPDKRADDARFIESAVATFERSDLERHVRVRD
jgi:hypothetical protein